MYLPRALEEAILKAWEPKKVLIIKGPRQAGKTTLVRHLVEKMGGVYYTLDNPRTLEVFEHFPEDLVKDETIYIDEVQNSPHAGRILRYLYDEHRVRIVVTGSGAFDRKLGITAYLVGRFKEFTLLPLSFSEFLHWKSELLWRVWKRESERLREAVLNGQGEVKVLSSLKQAFRSYLRLGGYPEAVLTGNRGVIGEIVKATLERDIINFFGVSRERMGTFFTHLSRYAGNIIALNALGVDFKTARHYLGILEDAFLIRRVLPFHRDPTKEVKRAFKAYFYDVGVYSYFSGREGFGNEHFVFRQLLPERYWRNKHGAEVDFLFPHKGHMVPIEVKSHRLSGRSLRSFIEEYAPPFSIVFGEYEGLTVKEYKGTPIYHVPIYFAEFLTGLEGSSGE